MSGEAAVSHMIASPDVTLDGYTPSPAVIAAEMAVAGAVIQSRTALEEAASLLDPSDFYSPAGTVFAAALAVHADGRHIEPVAILEELQARGDLNRVGGGPYLHTLMQHAATGNISYHAGLISGDAVRRRVHLACQRALHMTTSPAWDPEADLDQIRKELDQAAARTTGEPPTVVAEEMAALLDELENPPAAPPGVTPPYRDLADLVPAFRPGELIVVGARPSIGKSTLGIDLVRSAAVHAGQRCLLVTLEMPARQVLQRITAAEAKVPLKSITDHTVTEEELDRIAEAGVRIGQAPLVIDYAPGCTIARIRATLRSMSRTAPAELLVVDYLGLMTAPRAENRQQEVATLSRELKLIAGEFNLPVVALSQLNRGPEQRADKRPQMSDLRESGAVEQDADVVILLHREDAYDPESPRAGEVDLIVAKHRNGPTGTVTIASQLHYARFVDMAAPPLAGRPDLRTA